MPLSKSLLASLTRLLAADEGLKACEEETTRVPAGAGGGARRDLAKVVEAIRDVLSRARHALREASDLFVLYEEVLSRPESSVTGRLVEVRVGLAKKG